MYTQLIFLNKKHEQYFQELMNQGEGALTPRQIAFIYLIACFQEDYIRYEGMPFWLEVYEEVSIDGPVYLLEDHVKLGKKPHEEILIYAKKLLQGLAIEGSSLSEQLKDLVQIAEQFIMDQENRKRIRKES